jgi:NTP pyrophosphatase (non-canonical NTP hydrolase)
MSAPHDRPSATELLEAVREFLRDDVEPELAGRLRYLLKVATNVLAIVERELELGPEQAARHTERLRRLGFESDAELARAIRSGELDDRLGLLETELKDMVADKLAVARPDHNRR